MLLENGSVARKRRQKAKNNATLCTKSKNGKKRIREGETGFSQKQE